MRPINLRRCVSCRELAPKENFWRIVRCFGTDAVQLDQGMGRSAYLCPTLTCLEQAQKKRRLSKALRTRVRPEIYQTLARRLKDSQVRYP